jgi:hypothetical protein
MATDTLIYLGHYETSFCRLHADQDRYWTKTETEEGHLGKRVDEVPDKYRNGIHFGFMQTSEGFIFVRVNRLVLPTPVLFIGERHGPRAPGPAWSGIDSAVTLNILADAIVANPGFRDELLRLTLPGRHSEPG